MDFKHYGSLLVKQYKDTLTPKEEYELQLLKRQMQHYRVTIKLKLLFKP